MGLMKFGPGYRFDLFPSLALGWTASNESFMGKAKDNWLNKLKFRGSYGIVGDDKPGADFAYLGVWGNGGSACLVPSVYDGSGDRSPYIFYTEEGVGNPNLQWETAIKYNIGAEMSLFKGLFTAEFDYFAENRENVFVTGSARSIARLVWCSTSTC